MDDVRMVAHLDYLEFLFMRVEHFLVIAPHDLDGKYFLVTLCAVALLFFLGVFVNGELGLGSFQVALEHRRVLAFAQFVCLVVLALERVEML